MDKVSPGHCQVGSVKESRLCLCNGKITLRLGSLEPSDYIYPHSLSTIMLPANIHNSYVEYKADTNIYIIWLVSTAVQCGSTPPYKSTGPGAQSKSKARSKKPEQREASNKSLLACATAIISKPPKQFEVLHHVTRSAARAIRQRTKTTLWHPDQPQDLDEDTREHITESNDAHAYFNSILKRTLELLRPFIPRKTKSQNDHNQEAAASVDTLSNRFRALEIDGLAEEDLGTSTDVPDQKPTAPRVTYVVDQSKEDQWLAMASLLHDYTNLKMVIGNTWKHYAWEELRNIDFIIAAVTSQAAMQMIRSLVHEFTSLFPHISSMEKFFLELLREPYIKSDLRTASEEDEDRIKLGNRGDVPLLHFTNFCASQLFAHVQLCLSHIGSFLPPRNSLGEAGIHRSDDRGRYAEEPLR